ncbi:hypothetical protein EV378_1548 [Pseudonocardia endophytica]|uniref:Uncharacterized protein n=1 Tax=Pseudonocardia endophytica TaxID=401976 RepID=A0A4R1HU05_PSEEN|nr:hypothetical protein EV378_1548 [Pseudonocardia endophytica]
MTAPAGLVRLLTRRRHIDLCLINGGVCPGH